jgi:hypothetical protein
MLRVSYRGEIRPEAPERVFEVFQAQKEILTGIAKESLQAAERKGEVLVESGTYRWVRRPGKGAWVATTLYFITSKIRATTRWFKYMITFDGWLDYIQRKIERRAGFEVEIEERDRRWPLIFLWPKLFFVLRSIKEPEETTEADQERESA